jgi:hypothetical protein
MLKILECIFCINSVEMGDERKDDFSQRLRNVGERGIRRYMGLFNGMGFFAESYLTPDINTSVKYNLAMDLLEEMAEESGVHQGGPSSGIREY